MAEFNWWESVARGTGIKAPGDNSFWNPWAIDGGRVFTVISHPKALLLINGNYVTSKPVPCGQRPVATKGANQRTPTGDTVLKIIGSFGDSVGADTVGRLRELAGEVPQYLCEQVACEKCKGEGETTCDYCKGSGETECSECSHVNTCDDCSGLGKDKCSGCGGEKFLIEDKWPEATYLRIGAVHVDRRLLALMLSMVPNEAVTIGATDDVLRINGGDWRLAIVGKAGVADAEEYQPATSAEALAEALAS